jgi:aminomethyltransferase
MNLITIPLNQIHIELGAKMVPFAGFYMPVRYTSDLDEHNTVRNAVGLFDVSHMGELWVTGKDATIFLQKTTANNVTKLYNGKVQYSYIPNEDGGIVDDLLIYRFNEEKYLLVVNASNIEKDYNWLVSKNSFDCSITNVSSQYCLFALQGPKAIDVLKNITQNDIINLPYYHFLETLLNNTPVMISNTGYTGAGGFEIYVKVENALPIWNLLLDKGKEFGIKPIGLGARDTLRLEMGFCLYGNDISDQTNPIEANLKWVTYLEKDFIGKDKILSKPITQKLVGLKMLDRGIPRGGYSVLDENKNIIGKITSGTLSPTLGYGIALAYLDLPYTQVGTSIYVEVRNQALKAEVTKVPFINQSTK